MSLGRSLGPTTTIATTAMTRSSDQPMSNMCALQGEGRGTKPPASVRFRLARFPAARGLGAGGRLGGARLGGLVVDDLRLLGGHLVLVLGHALLEALDALGDVAHQLGNLAAPEQKHEEHEHDQNMRPAQSHSQVSIRVTAGLASARVLVSAAHYGSKG